MEATSVSAASEMTETSSPSVDSLKAHFKSSRAASTSFPTNSAHHFGNSYCSLSAVPPFVIFGYLNHIERQKKEGGVR